MTGPPGKRRRGRRGTAPDPSKRTSHSSNSPKHNDGPARPQGLRPIGEVAAEIVANLRFRRQVVRLHRLGPRSMAELLAEIGAERSITTIIDRKLDRYAELDPETLEVTGGDGFWPLPLREV